MILLIIFLSLFIGLNGRYHPILIIALLLSLFVFIYKRLNKKFILVSLIFFSLGVGTSFIKITNSGSSFEGIVVESKQNYIILLSKFEKIYVYEKNNEYEIGDIINVSGTKSELNFTVLESSFDFNEYLNKKGIYYQIANPKIKTKLKFFLRCKAIRNSFLKNFNEETASLINSILFGINDYSEINSDISSLHLGKLLSIGGVYIHIFMDILLFILSIKLKDKHSRIISLIVLSFYAIFTFPRFSVIKIMFIYLLRWLNDYVFKKKFSYLEILSFSGLFFLLIDYHLAYQTSFILGYLIVIFLRLYDSSFSHKSKITGGFLKTIVLSLFMIPFSLSFSNEINLLTPLYTTLFTPFFILINITALVCFCKIPLYSVCNFFVAILKNILSFLKPISLSLYASAMTDIFLVIYYFILFFVLYYKTINFKPMFRISATFYGIFLTFYFIPLKNLVTNEVCFINVGQGDSCLIRKGTLSVLIDTGGLTYTDVATNTLIPFFKKKKIYNLDLVITTHDDYDHKGALDSLLKNFNVKKYVSSYELFPYNIGNLSFKNYNIYQTSWAEENDKSLVIGFNLNNKNYLIMGDAPKKIEKLIMNDYPNIPCDIIKVGHHGSNTSSDDSFIKHLNPKEAVISVGQNKFGHPHKEVLSILSKNNIKVRRTDEEGTIIY